MDHRRLAFVLALRVLLLAEPAVAAAAAATRGLGVALALAATALEFAPIAFGEVMQRQQRVLVQLLAVDQLCQLFFRQLLCVCWRLTARCGCSVRLSFRMRA